MWVRKRLDIGWRDLIAALGYALLPGQGALRGGGSSSSGKPVAQRRAAPAQPVPEL